MAVRRLVAGTVKAQTDGRGAEVVFDAGVTFETVLSCLAHRGRLIEIAATGRRRVEFDLLDFVHNESLLFGADIRRSVWSNLPPSLTSSRRFSTRARSAPLVHWAVPPGRGIEAYQAVAAGAEARVVIEP